MAEKRGKRRGPGRPPLPRVERLGRRVVLNLTREEYEELVEQADEVPIAVYLRALVRRHLRRQ